MSVFDGLKFRKVISPIHNLDPRMKFVYVIAIFVAAIVFYQIIPLLCPLCYAVTVCAAWRGCRSSGCVPCGERLFWRSSYSSLTSEPPSSRQGFTLPPAEIERAVSMTLRFVVLVESFSVFFLTTSPDHLGLALGEFPCALRIRVCLHHCGSLCASAGGGSPNNHGRAESPRLGTGKRRVA